MSDCHQHIGFALIFGPWLPVVGLFLQNEAHCAEVGGSNLSLKRHTCSSRHFQPRPLFFAGISERQLHQQRIQTERERDGSKKKGCTEQWLYLEPRVRGGIDKQS